MGLGDAFGKEDTATIGISQLIEILDARARAEANFAVAIKMCEIGVNVETIAKVFEIDESEV